MFLFLMLIILFFFFDYVKILEYKNIKESKKGFGIERLLCECGFKRCYVLV